MAPRLRSTFAFLCLVAMTAALGGCVSGGSWVGLTTALLFAGLAGLGCARGGIDAADAGPGGTDAADPNAGTWETCCENGRLATCYCPPNTACNYGRYQRCGDGTCGDYSRSCPTDAGADAVVDATSDVAGDALGTWPADPPRDAPADRGDVAVDQLVVPLPPDGGVPCCENGRLATCDCPPLRACNYAPFRACQDGTCVLTFGWPDGGGMCPAPTDARSH